MFQLVILAIILVSVHGQKNLMTNYNNNLKLESRIMNSPPIDNYIKFPEDRIDNLHSVETKYKLTPAYNLPDEIFNDGRPFYVDKDPETGRPDFSTKRTSLIEDHLPESAQELRLTNINYLTPNFHDYLNLPTKYNPEKFLYPIISSSYANMKIQGNTVKSSANGNHKEAEGSKKSQVATKNETDDLLRRPTTLRSVTTTAAPTTAMPTTMMATTTTTTTSTTMKPKKTSSFIEQLFESFVDENENDDQRNSPIKPRIEEENDNGSEDGDDDSNDGAVGADEENSSGNGNQEEHINDNDGGNEYENGNYEDNEPDNKRLKIDQTNSSSSSENGKSTTMRSDEMSSPATMPEHVASPVVPTSAKPSSQSEIVHLEDIFKDLNEYSTISYNNGHNYDDDGNEEPENDSNDSGDSMPKDNETVKEADLVTVKAYTVKSTTERRSGGDNPNVVLSVVSRVVPSFEEPDENTAIDNNNNNHNHNNDENVQIVTKETNDSLAVNPLQFPAANSQGFVNVAPHQDTVSLVLGQKESMGAGYKPESAANEPNNYINRRSDVTLSQQQNSLANDLNILSLNSKPFSHQLPTADNFGAPPATPLQFKGWETVPVLYPAKLYIEQRLPPPSNLPNIQSPLQRPPPPPPLKNLPNILPQFKPNNRLWPQFLSDFYPGPKAPPRGGHPQRRFHLQRDRYPQLQGNDRKRFDDNRVFYQSHPQSSLVPPAVQQLPSSIGAMKPHQYPMGSQAPLPPQLNPHLNTRSNDQLFVDEESGLYKEPPKILALDSNNEVKTLQMLKNYDNDVKTGESSVAVDKESANLQKNPLYVVYPSVPESATIADSSPNRLSEKFSTIPSVSEEPLVSTTTTTTTTEPAAAATKPITTEDPNQLRVTLKIGNDYDHVNHHKPVFEVYANNQNSLFGFKKSPTPTFDANYYMNNKNYYPKAGETGQSPVALEFEAPFFPSTSYDLNREPWKVVDQHNDDDNNEHRQFQERSDANVPVVNEERPGDASSSSSSSSSVALDSSDSQSSDNDSINVSVSSGNVGSIVPDTDPITKTIDANSFSPQYEGGFQPIFPDSEHDTAYETANKNVNAQS